MHSTAGWSVVELAGVGESCTNYEGNLHGSKSRGTAARIHDSSGNSNYRRSWKGAGVVMSAGAFQVSGKIARRRHWWVVVGTMTNIFASCR